MLKLIIFNNDINSIQKICNSLFIEDTELHLSGMTTSLEEFYFLFERVNPDVILVDYQNYISNNLSEYTKNKLLKILFCNDKINYKVTSNELLVPVNDELSSVVKSIKTFIAKQNTNLLRKKVIKILQSFGFDFKLIGTTYILESILYCYEYKTDYVFENLEKNVYPFVAAICKTNVINVKHAIVRSINSMHRNFSLADKKHLAENFKVDIFEKATAKQFISMIINKL